MIDRAAAFDAGEAPSLQLFLDAIERRGGEVKRELSGPQDEVRVMTVHGAKGLEAPIVILPDTCSAHGGERDGVFMTEDGAPIWAGSKSNDIELSANLRAVAEARALREHRRLLYVALTRAQDRLIVCGAFTGHPKSAGHTETSWYTVANSAMQRLVANGRAQEVEDGDRRAENHPPLWRCARTPHPRCHRATHRRTLPAWLTRPITLEFKDRILSPSNPCQPPPNRPSSRPSGQAAPSACAAAPSST